MLRSSCLVSCDSGGEECPWGDQGLGWFHPDDDNGGRSSGWRGIKVRGRRRPSGLAVLWSLHRNTPAWHLIYYVIGYNCILLIPTVYWGLAAASACAKHCWAFSLFSQKSLEAGVLFFPLCHADANEYRDLVGGRGGILNPVNSFPKPQHLPMVLGFFTWWKDSSYSPSLVLPDTLTFTLAFDENSQRCIWFCVLCPGSIVCGFLR